MYRDGCPGLEVRNKRQRSQNYPKKPIKSASTTRQNYLISGILVTELNREITDTRFFIFEKFTLKNLVSSIIWCLVVSTFIVTVRPPQPAFNFNLQVKIVKPVQR